MLARLQRLTVRSIRLSAPVRYGVAVGLTACATLLRVLLAPLWGQFALPFITFWPAVMVSGWLGGFGPGVMTTLLTALIAVWLWIPPAHELGISTPSDAVALVLFVTLGVFISLLNELLHRQTTASLHSEQELRTTIASIGDAVLATDQRGRVTQLNPVAEALTGWSEAMALGRPAEEVLVVVNEQSRLPAALPVQRVLTEGKTTEIENHTLLVARDGRTIPIDDSAAPIRAPDGTISGVVMVFRDVTERRRSEDLLRLAIEAAPTAMLIVDQHGAIVLVNELAEQLFGYARAELMGQSIDRLVPQRFRSGHADHRAMFYQEMRHRTMGAGRELFALRKDGSEFAVEIGLSPITAAGEPLVIAAVTDITERRQLATAERQARSDAERANRAKDDFLAMLSHELRTPLNTIVGWIGMIRAGALTARRMQHALDVIERNVHAERRLVESLLDVSRIVSGKIELTRERVDLGMVVEAAVGNARLVAGDKDISVTAQLPEQPVVIAGDELRLQQILANLLSNAVTFTRHGGHVCVRLAREGSRALLQVTDDGEGIAPEALPHVFDRFWQGEPGKQRARGIGLGLTVVQDLVTVHGGRVTATSDGLGKGSTFTVSLPIPVLLPPRTTPPPTRTVDVVSLAGLEVLVVDDDPDARELLGFTLGARGAVVRTAATAGEALQMLDSTPADILIADVEMPHEDGYVLLRTLRTQERDRQAQRLPAIALTASAGSSERERAERVGFDLHLAKPVEPAALVQAVAQHHR